MVQDLAKTGRCISFYLLAEQWMHDRTFQECRQPSFDGTIALHGVEHAQLLGHTLHPRLSTRENSNISKEAVKSVYGSIVYMKLVQRADK